MSKISIVADDTCVTVDGVGKVFAMDDFPTDVHAVHYDTVTSTGQVEYKDIYKDNEDITSLSTYQTYVDVWNVTQTAEEIAAEEYEAEQAAAIAEQNKEMREAHEAMTYVEKRERLYEVMGNQYEMMYDDAKNGTTIWQDSIDAIKAKIPKEWTPPAWDTMKNDDGTPMGS